MRPDVDGVGGAVAGVPPEAAAALARAGTQAGDRDIADAGRTLVVETEQSLDQQSGIVTAANAVVSDSQGRHAASGALPEVLAEVPVAVLVIDQKASAVTYANAAADDLAGNIGLPVDIDRWGAAAGLTDLDGEPLAQTSGPLSMVAQGQPIAGEAVRLSSRARADGAGRPADDGAEDQLLWVTGFPLSRTGSDEQLALVVFLEIDRSDMGDRAGSLQYLRERAVIATDITFTITDPREPDHPLVWVNPSFTRVTGYSFEESVGRNCRFLQGPATDPAAVEVIRGAIAEQQPITTTLLNYRRDGTAFWNQLSISPVFDGAGELVSYVGVQTDVTERVRVEKERAEAFAAEQSARREAEEAQAIAEQARADAERARADAERARQSAEQAQRRLALMAEATSTLSATLEMDELLDRLAGLCVPLLADWVFLTLVDEAGAVRHVSSRHRDGRAEDLAAFTELHFAHLPVSSPTRRSVSKGQPVLVPELTTAVLEEVVPSAPARRLFGALGGTTALAVPMVARRRTLGAIGLVRSSAEQPYTQEDVDLAADLARRAALAMDNVRLYQQEHTVADTLQRSLLPTIPDVPGIESAAHYVSASTAGDVGGDFYDLLELPDASVGIVVGDVLGHDVTAAAAMGHLRGLLRACIWDDGEPGRALTRVDRLVQGLDVASMATMVYARAVRPGRPGDPWQLHIANAGHPPMLLRDPGGEVRLLDGITGLLVGVDASSRRTTTVVDVPAGSTLVAYTDGLIERPGTDIDEGIAQLAARVAAAPVDAAPGEVCSAAVEGVLDRRDDVALIVVRFS